MMIFITILISERNLFKSGHLQFLHNLKEGIVILAGHFDQVKLVNLAARQMLKLPFKEDPSSEDPLLFKNLELLQLGLGEKRPDTVEISSQIYVS